MGKAATAATQFFKTLVAQRIAEIFGRNTAATFFTLTAKRSGLWHISGLAPIAGRTWTRASGVTAKKVKRNRQSITEKRRAAELELAHILQGRGCDIDPGRAQSYGEVPDVSGLPGIHMEVKRREPWLVTMKLEDWLDIFLKNSERSNTQ